LTNEVRYVYDHNLVIQERDSNNVPKLTYTRGVDLSRSFQRAGGIGGLLAMTQNGSTNQHFYYDEDGVGNITGLFDTNLNQVAYYLYDPFGNPIFATGPMTGINRYGFSSKEFMANPRLTYFGGRFYDPGLQRFLNQDPIGENGGINLYRFVRNSPNNAVDPYGLAIGDWLDPRTWFFMRLSEQYRLDQYAKSHGYRDYNDALDQLNARLPNYDPNETDSIARELRESVQLAAEGIGDAATLYIAAATAVTPTASGVKCLTAAEQSAANKLNNILTKNFKRGPKGDISGAIHDMVGNPIPKPSAGTYDHVQDLGNLLRGLRNNADALKDATDAAAAAARQQALEAIQEIEEAIRRVGL